jgi:hypothetical protein
MAFYRYRPLIVDIHSIIKFQFQNVARITQDAVAKRRVPGGFRQPHSFSPETAEDTAPKSMRTAVMQ